MRALGLVNWTYGDSFDVEKIEEGRQLVKQARAKKSNITVLSDTGSAGTKLGRHDQWHHDPVRRLG